MFDDVLRAALPADVLELAAETHRENKRTGCQKLVIAARWADLHSAVRRGDHEDTAGGMSAERLIEMGPQGCPQVAETAPTDLAMVFQTSLGGAKGLIRDSLNLRHRLPRTWARICTGEIHAWKARALAQRSAHLSVLAAAEVDRLLAGHLELVAWRRFEKMLDATLLHVDEKTYRERAERMATHRDVWATDSSDGLRTLIARADAGDVTVFLALVNRIAEALADDGDEDPIAARRAKAIGIAGYPDRALDLLLRHRHQPDTHRPPHEQAADHLAVHDHRTAPGGITDPWMTDPWAEGPPTAGWQNAEHGNYSQPDPDDPDYTARQSCPVDPDDPEPAADEPPVDPTDLDWLHTQTATGAADATPADDTPDAEGAPESAAAPEGAAAKDREPARRYANTGGIGLTEALAAFADLDAHTLAAAHPQVVIHLHMSDETARTGRGVIRTPDGPITADQFRRFLGDTGGDIKIYPVLDPGSVAAVDGYEIPLKLRRVMSIRHPESVFPLSPITTGLDLDHTNPYRQGGPPGQTATGHLGPLARGEHRSRTHGGCDVRQPDPGTYAWRTRHGQVGLVTNQGTLLLGATSFGDDIWRAAEKAGQSQRLLKAV